MFFDFHPINWYFICQSYRKRHISYLCWCCAKIWDHHLQMQGDPDKISCLSPAMLLSGQGTIRVVWGVPTRAQDLKCAHCRPPQLSSHGGHLSGIVFHN
jgi:hypothetical protein